MAGGYTDTPLNMEEILPYVITDKEIIVKEMLERQKCYFYDTCSFRRHANFHDKEAEYLLRYIQGQNGVIAVTRCILMELGSQSGRLNQNYVNYIKHIKDFGLTVLLLYEEDLFFVMEIAFGTNAAINYYLCWAVRMMKGPVSTITKTLDQNACLYDEVIRGKNLEHRGVYKHFFETVRANKESEDDLGEELLAVCLHILSYLPGEEDGKFCVITDDKGAASKIDLLFKRTAKQYTGKKIGIFSTPKLVQVMKRENILLDREDMKTILCTGTEGKIVILGTSIYDIRAGELSLDGEVLADLIMQANGIHIIF